MTLPIAAQKIIFQEYVRAITHLVDRLAQIEDGLHEHVKGWRLAPLIAAYQARREVQFYVAVTMVTWLTAVLKFPATPIYTKIPIFCHIFE